MSLNVRIYVRLDRGTAYSSSRRETSWSMFDTALVAVPGSLLHVPYAESYSVGGLPVGTYIYVAIGINIYSFFQISETVILDIRNKYFGYPESTLI